MHILLEEIDRWESQTDNNIVMTTDVDMSKLVNWKEEFETMMQNELKLDDNLHHYDTNHDEGNVLAIDDLLQSEYMDVGERKENESEMTREILNDEQRHAFDIVDWHLREMLAGKQSPQLWMVIPGE